MLRYHHVDVFTDRPYSGNSLTVFPDSAELDAAQMLRITQEMRHFESIFLARRDDAWGARVFDLIEELDFAGHPLIGAACVLHSLYGTAETETWTVRLTARTVRVTTRRRASGHFASRLDQGPAAFLGEPDASEVLALLSLCPDDLDADLAPEVVSTGLRYLVLPVSGDALAQARVTNNLDAALAAIGAQYVYLLDAAGREGRHWTNDGVVEDVATGSGAGCAAGYLRRHDRIGNGEPTVLRQGRFTGRPSELTIAAHGQGEDIRSVTVGGDVVLVGTGELTGLPR